MTTPAALLEDLRRDFLARAPIRTGSLIVTLFGDAIAPRGGRIWLGSLIEVLGAVGIGERAVRTAVYRLVQDGIVEGQSVGRRTEYALTSNAASGFAHATARIYRHPGTVNGGTAAGSANVDPRPWTLLLVTGLERSERDALRRRLGGLGFGSLPGDLFVHPDPDSVALASALAATGVTDRAVRFRSTVNPTSGWSSEPRALRELVSRAWDAAVLEGAWRPFIERLTPAAETLAAAQEGACVADRRTAVRSDSLDPETAFLIRTFAIHAYRRAVLHDPGLAPDLAPHHATVLRAFELARTVYAATVAASERFVDVHFANRDGPLPAPDAAFRARFTEPVEPIARPDV